MNALGRVNSTSTFNVGIVRLDSWHANDLFFRLEFDTSATDAHKFSGSYSCKVALRVEDGREQEFVKLYDISELHKDA